MDSQKVLNLSSAIILILGAILKTAHLPGAGPALVLSSILIIITIFLYTIKDNKAVGVPNSANYLLSITLAIAVLGALFSGMNWEGSSYLVLISVFLNIIVTFLLIISKSPFKISKQYIISVFLYFCILSSLMAIQTLMNLLNVVTQ